MGQCKICNSISGYISKQLQVCLNCIRERPEDALSIAMQAHKNSRLAFGLPEQPPKAEDGITCNLCVNECKIPNNEVGYCGLRKNIDGKLIGVSYEEGNFSWYYDPLPTNCVGSWVCPAGTGAGYPKYAYSLGPEYGYKNLAVFFHGCSFNCLYCQNWHFKERTFNFEKIKLDKFVSYIDDKTSCICYFGGDPTPQTPFVINASRTAIERNKGKILRICWETNGSMHKSFLKEIIEIALISGGCIKFDLKAWNENLHIALTGVTNKRTLENFKLVSDKIRERPIPPLLIASTLLLPGYIDEEEIRNIARFIKSIDPDIPYSLLGFYPHFYMSDIPFTSKSDAIKYFKIAKQEGLKNVKIANIHLLH